MRTVKKITVFLLLTAFAGMLFPGQIWAETGNGTDEMIIRSVLAGSEEFRTTGTWAESSMTLDDGSKSLMCNTPLTGDEVASAVFQPKHLSPGLYVVYFYVPYNGASDTRATVRIANGEHTNGFTRYQNDFYLDEVNNASNTEKWVRISASPIEFKGDGNDYVEILRTHESSSYTRVGCVKFVPFAYQDTYIVENPQVLSSSAYTPVYPTTVFTGTWAKSSAAKLSYKETENSTLYATKAGATARFYADLIQQGEQRVWFFSPNGNDQNDTMVSITIHHNGITEEAVLFDQMDPEHKGQWVELTTLPLEFSGDGSEYVEIKRINPDNTVSTATRVGAIKFSIPGDEPLPTATAEPEVRDIIIDNMDKECTFDAPWMTSTASASYYGINYALDNTPAADAGRWAKWTPEIPEDGAYHIYMCWAAHFNRAAAAPLEIRYAGGIDTTKTVNQTEGNGWIYIGTYDLAAGKENYVKILADCTGYTIADAVKFEPVRTFSIEGYTDYQVFQRDIGGDSRMVPLSVSNPREDAGKIQLSVIEEETGKEVIPWTDFAVNPEPGIITRELRVPQGGWYYTKLRAYDTEGGLIEEYTSVKKWGVGIVILCAGQSNMNGQGGAPYTIADDRVTNYNKSGNWEHLNDPYAGEGGSMVPALGNALTAQYGIPVAFVPAAVSGAGLCQYGQNVKVWETRNEKDPYDTNTYYGASITRAKEAGGVELIVWNQGETDGKYLITRERYKQGFTTLIENYRKDLYAEIPIFTCQIGTHDTNISNDFAYSEIRSAQDELDNGKDIFMAATEMEFVRKDTAHYTTPGLNVIGQRVANAIMYYYGDRTSYRGPKIIGAQFAGTEKDAVDVKIMHRGGDDITPDAEITGFTVAAGGQDISVLRAERISGDTIRLTLEEPVGEGGVVRYLYGVNPPNTNVVKDNSAMKLPLEATIADVPIAGRGIYTEGLQFFAGDTPLTAGRPVSGGTIRLSGVLQKNPAFFDGDTVTLAAALYNQADQLVDCKTVVVDFAGKETAELEESLFHVPDGEHYGMRIFFWESLSAARPVTDSLDFL